jgi:hypothetical protein
VARIALLILSCSVLGACSTVSSPVPLGSEPAALDPAAWEGAWSNPDGTLEITVTDATNGLARMIFEEDGEKQELNLVVRQSGEWIFANVTEEDFDDSQGLDGEGDGDSESGESYLWVRVKLKSGAIIAWDPDAEAFAELVSAGVLPGSVNEGDVVLGALSPEHYEIITSGSHGVLMNWDEPAILYRVQGLEPE